MKILFMAATPRDTPFLKSKAEYKKIETSLRNTPAENTIDFIVSWETYAEELTDLLLDNKPDIIHFSGHGLPLKLMFTDKNGESRTIHSDILRRIIQKSAIKPKLIVLNCCFSSEEAEKLAEIVGFAIGMQEAIEDDAAVLFSARFYHYLGLGYPVKNSFELALIDLEVNNYEKSRDAIALFTQEDLDEKNAVIVDKAYKGYPILANNEVWNDFVSVVEFTKNVHHIFQVLSIQNLAYMLELDVFQPNTTTLAMRKAFSLQWTSYVSNHKNLLVSTALKQAMGTVIETYDRLKNQTDSANGRLFSQNTDHLTAVLQMLQKYDFINDELEERLEGTRLTETLTTDEGIERVGTSILNLQNIAQQLVTNSDEFLRRTVEILTRMGGSHD